MGSISVSSSYFYSRISSLILSVNFVSEKFEYVHFNSINANISTTCAKNPFIRLIPKFRMHPQHQEMAPIHSCIIRKWLAISKISYEKWRCDARYVCKCGTVTKFSNRMVFHTFERFLLNIRNNGNSMMLSPCLCASYHISAVLSLSLTLSLSCHRVCIVRI